MELLEHRSELASYNVERTFRLHFSHHICSTTPRTYTTMQVWLVAVPFLLLVSCSHQSIVEAASSCSCPLPKVKLTDFAPCMMGPNPACCNLLRPYANNPCTPIWLRSKEVRPYAHFVDPLLEGCSLDLKPECIETNYDQDSDSAQRGGYTYGDGTAAGPRARRTRARRRSRRRTRRVLPKLEGPGSDTFEGRGPPPQSLPHPNEGLYGQQMYMDNPYSLWSSKTDFRGYHYYQT